MSNYISLLGSEEVGSAGRAMVGAAESMLRAANLMDSTTDRLQRILEEHASRVEAAAERQPTTPEPTIRPETEVIAMRETQGRFSALMGNFQALKPSDQQKVLDLTWQLTRARVDVIDGGSKG